MVAGLAALGSVKLARRRREPHIGKLRCVRTVGFTALRAEATNQALSQDGQDRAGDQEWLDTHVNQPREGAGCIVGVEGREDQVTREGGLDRIVCRGLIACLSHEDDVGVLPQMGTKDAGEG